MFFDSEVEIYYDLLKNDQILLQFLFGHNLHTPHWPWLSYASLALTFLHLTGPDLSTPPPKLNYASLSAHHQNDRFNVKQQFLQRHKIQYI